MYETDETSARGKQVPGASPFRARSDISFARGRKVGRSPRHVAERGRDRLAPDVAGRNMQEEFGEAIIGNNGQRRERERWPLFPGSHSPKTGEFLEAIGAQSAHTLSWQSLDYSEDYSESPPRGIDFCHCGL